MTIVPFALASAISFASIAISAPPAVAKPPAGEAPDPTTSIPPTAPSTESPALDPAARAARLREAQQRLDAGDFAAAEPLLAEVRAYASDPRVGYNLGLCAFEAGRYGDAAMLFEEASLAADAALAQRAMFNQGNARYRQGVEMVEAASTAPEGQPPAAVDSIAALEQALEPLRSALTHFRDAVRSNPKDRDARANAELTHRTIREIEQTIEELRRQQEQQEQQQQDQQQQGQDSDQQQGEQDQSKDGSEQDQSGQQDQQQNDSQQQPQQPQDQSGQQGQPQDQSQQQQDQSGQQGQPQDQSQQQQDQSGQQGQPQTPAGQPGSTPPPAVDPMEAIGEAEPSDAGAMPEGELAAASEGGEESKAGEKRQGVAAAPARLSKEQAERLLQLIRDKEQQRRAALALERQRQRQRSPVRQDW